MFGGLFYVSHVAEVSVTPNFWWYNFCGVLWGMSVVIPGMTSSSVMMALGLYQPMLDGWPIWIYWCSPPVFQEWGWRLFCWRG